MVINDLVQQMLFVCVCVCVCVCGCDVAVVHGSVFCHVSCVLYRIFENPLHRQPSLGGTSVVRCSTTHRLWKSNNFGVSRAIEFDSRYRFFLLCMDS